MYRGLKYYTPGITGYVDVRDVAKLMILLMESDITAERFVLNAENLSYENVFKSIAINFHKPEPNIVVKKWMANIAWRIELLKGIIIGRFPKITRETVAAGFNKVSYSNSKIISKFNYNFIPIEKSIAETCKIFLAEQNSL